MSDESSIFCHNCQREIPTSNYQMHVVHCQRNIQLCLKCQEPVPRSELSNHDLEFHTPIKCTDCGKALESSSLDDHKKTECPKRQKSCQYCDIELRADTMFEHEEYCGSRTEICEVCKELVMLKYQRMHEESGHRKTKPNQDESEDVSDEDGAIASRRENTRNHYQNTRNSYHDRRSHRQPDIPFGIHRQGFDLDDDLDASLENLELDNARNRTTIRSFRPEVNRSVQAFERDSNSDEKTLIPCEFCDVPIVAEQLILHQTGCRPDLSSAPRTPRPKEGRNRNFSDENGVHTRQNEAFPRMVDAIVIPCEFCQKPFDLDLFSIHQSACPNRPAIRSSNQQYEYYDDE